MVYLYSFFNLDGRLEWVVSATLEGCIPGKETPITIIQEAVCAPG